MGLCASGAANLSPEDRQRLQQEKARSKELEKQLSDLNHQDNQINKLLLLGPGESGKSTLFKQMITIYGKGFNEQDRKGYVAAIHGNMMLSAKTLVSVSGTHVNTVPVAESLAEEVKMVDEASPDAPIDAKMAEAMKKLWEDPGIQNTYRHRSRFQLTDSTAYFFEALDRMSKPDYVPTYQDVLRARIRTTGIVEQDFIIDKNHFKIIDVGGQRNERKKWIHCFADVTAVLFLAAISEYDQVLFEDETTNRMEEALILFGETCNSRWFRKTSIILMLNKRDIFAEKILTVPVKDFFRDYAGPEGDAKAALTYFTERFQAEKKDPAKLIYVHVTCATDTDQMRAILNAVKDIVIRRSLEDGGLLT